MKIRYKKMILFANGFLVGFMVFLFVYIFYSEKTCLAIVKELRDGACYYKDIRFFSWTTDEGEECISFLRERYPFLMLKVDLKGRVSSLLLHDDRTQLLQYSFREEEGSPAIFIYSPDQTIIGAIVSDTGATWNNFWYRLDNISSSDDGNQVYFYDFNFDSIADARQVVNEKSEILYKSIYLDNKWENALSLNLQAFSAIVSCENGQRKPYMFRGEKWEFVK